MIDVSLVLAPPSPFNALEHNALPRLVLVEHAKLLTKPLELPALTIAILAPTISATRTATVELCSTAIHALMMVILALMTFVLLALAHTLRMLLRVPRVAAHVILDNVQTKHVNLSMFVAVRTINNVMMEIHVPLMFAKIPAPQELAYIMPTLCLVMMVFIAMVLTLAQLDLALNMQAPHVLDKLNFVSRHVTKRFVFVERPMALSAMMLFIAMVSKHVKLAFVSRVAILAQLEAPAATFALKLRETA